MFHCCSSLSAYASKKQLEDAEMVLVNAVKAFDRMKNKLSKKLRRDIHTRIGYVFVTEKCYLSIYSYILIISVFVFLSNRIFLHVMMLCTIK